MQKSVLLWSFIGCFLLGDAAWAQLPANPWSVSNPQTGGVAKTSREAPYRQYISSIKYNPVNADKDTPSYRPVIDSSEKTKGVAIDNNFFSTQRDDNTRMSSSQYSSKNESWRGSGKYGNLNYTGSVTTYGTAYGQEMLAPEVNSHNMKVMLQHLRNLGYKIPESYDDKFQNFLAGYAKDLKEAYNGLGHQNNPFDTMFSGILDVVEDQTELDMENVLFNSVDLISRN